MDLGQRALMSAAVGAPWARGDLIAMKCACICPGDDCPSCWPRGEAALGKRLFWGVLRSHMG